MRMAIVSKQLRADTGMDKPPGDKFIWQPKIYNDE